MKIADLKTWRDADDFLKKQIKKFERYDANEVFIPYPDFLLFEKLLWESHRESEKGTQKAILQFLDTGRWPTMSHMEKYFCRCRIRFALSTLYFLRGGPRVKAPPAIIQEPAPHGNGRFLLHWLLVFNWQHFGESDWHQKLHREWKKCLEDEAFDIKDRKWFGTIYKIESLMVKEMSEDRKRKPPGCKTYKCIVTFQNGECHSVWIPSPTPPDENLVLEAFRKQRSCFVHLNPEK